MAGTIYFLQAGGVDGPIKIGYTKNLAVVRRKCAQTYNHLPLVILAEASGTKQEEKQLHEVFKEHHIRGEWFSPTQPLLELINSIVDTGMTLESYLSM